MLSASLCCFHSCSFLIFISFPFTRLFPPKNFFQQYIVINSFYGHVTCHMCLVYMICLICKLICISSFLCFFVFFSFIFFSICDTLLKFHLYCRIQSIFCLDMASISLLEQVLLVFPIILLLQSNRFKIPIIFHRLNIHSSTSIVSAPLLSTNYAIYMNTSTAFILFPFNFIFSHFVQTR